MEASRPLRDPPCAELGGIVGPLDHVSVVSTPEPDGFLTEYVDGGDHLDRKLEPHVSMLAC